MTQEGAGRDLARRIQHHFPAPPTSRARGRTVSTTPVEDAQPAGPRRVRHQARDAASLMAFSLAMSAAAAVGLLLLTSLGR